MKRRFILAAVFSLFALLVTTGCQKKTAKPADAADSSSVVDTAKTAEEEKMVEGMVTEPEKYVPASGKDSHTVVKGENLWTISEYSSVYDDPFQWPIIYKANKDQIKDPDLIYPDQEFELPRDSSQEEVDAARHEAKTRGPWSLWDGK